MSAQHPNARFIDHFGLQRDIAAKEGNKGHVIHNNRMVKLLRSLPAITCVGDLDGIKGVGPKTRAEISALLDAEEPQTPAASAGGPPPTPQAPKAAVDKKRKNYDEQNDDDSATGASAAIGDSARVLRRRVPPRALFGDQAHRSASPQQKQPEVAAAAADRVQQDSAPQVNDAQFSFGQPSSVQAPSLPNLLLAHSYDSSKHDVAGWLYSEKLDGVRAYWCGNALWTRQKNALNAPQWFIDALPRDTPLDGELYAGRGNFQDAVSVVCKHVPIDNEWRTIEFHVFDSPDGGAQTFVERLQVLRSAIGNANPVVRVVEHQKCDSHEHVSQLLEQIVADGGEGVMLRDPNSRYEGKRSKTLLKVKKAYDAEARVESHATGKGRNSDRVGALHCRMACGKAFKVGSGLTDAERDNPPPIGSIITYRFNELTRSGVPRFPRFVRVSERTEPADCVF